MRHLSYANIMATTAAVAALGTGSAVAANQITGAQVKNGTITGSDVRDRTLHGTDMSTHSLTSRLLASSSVAGRALRADSVTGSKIADGSIGMADLGADVKAALDASGGDGVAPPPVLLDDVSCKQGATPGDLLVSTATSGAMELLCAVPQAADAYEPNESLAAATTTTFQDFNCDCGGQRVWTGTIGSTSDEDWLQWPATATPSGYVSLYLASAVPTAFQPTWDIYRNGALETTNASRNTFIAASSTDVITVRVHGAATVPYTATISSFMI